MKISERLEHRIWALVKYTSMRNKRLTTHRMCQILKIQPSQLKALDELPWLGFIGPYFGPARSSADLVRRSRFDQCFATNRAFFVLWGRYYCLKDRQRKYPIYIARTRKPNATL